MKRVKNLILFGAFSLLVLGLPAIASAQYGQYDPYGRNGGYNNGRYGNYGNYGDTHAIVHDLKKRAKEFQHQLDRDLDHSRYNGSRREDQMNELAREFSDETNHLKSGNGNKDYYRIQRVLDLGRTIDRSISRSGIGNNAQNIWSGIRYDLDVLGQAYGYNGNYRHRNRNYPNNYPNNDPNNYPNNYPNNRGNLPSWWPF